MLEIRLQRHAAYRTSASELCKKQPLATNRTHKNRLHTGPTRFKSNPCSSEEQVDVGSVPGMNGSALRISQSVRDAAHITITAP